MGKLGKDFGFASKAKIGIVCDKQHYISGEIVRGTIYLQSFSPIQCDGVVLKATGKEKVSWEETRFNDGESYEVEFDEDKEFFKNKIVVSSFPRELPPGSYSYPFEYQLPEGLPGSFELKGEESNWGEVNKVKAKICYKLKATLDVGGYFAKDLKAKQELCVYSRLYSAIQPSVDDTTQSVNLFCCIPRGDCKLKVSMDKNAYMAGETAQIYCNIKNDSKVDIGKMRCRLVQVVTLIADGHQKTITNDIIKQSYPGVEAEKSVDQAQPLPITGNGIVPSTMGNFINCQYHIEVECAIDYCPDVELHLPITVAAPFIPSNSWVPENTSDFQS